MFIGYYQAKVIFHDISGNVVDKISGTFKNTESDEWYDYGENLKTIIPINKPSTGTLIGWTTIKSNEIGGGYSSISSSTLATIKDRGEFYEDGDPVTKSLVLYPIYADVLANITTIFEGNENDNSSNVSLRTGVGYTTSSLNENGNLVLDIKGYESNDELPDGYRFIGWYDDNNKFLSNDKEYTVTDIDLTTKHTFIAKFEYRVDYYVKRVFNTTNGVYNEGKLYHQIWQKYDTSFNNIAGLDFYKEVFEHWGLDDYQNDSSYNSNIKSHVVVYSSNKRDDDSSSSVNYTVDLINDFPGSAYIKQNNDTMHFTVDVIYDDSLYNFIGWSFESVGTNGKGTYYTPQTGLDSSYNFTNILPSVNYTYVGHLTANVTFYQKDGTSTTVTRRYKFITRIIWYINFTINISFFYISSGLYIIF